MKKLVSVLALVILVVSVFAACGTKSDSKLILGKWEGAYEFSSLNFGEDGIVSLGAIGMSTDGSYTVDEENDILSVTYKNLLGITYNKEYKYTVSETELSLVIIGDGENGVSLVYTRAVTEE